MILATLELGSHWLQRLGLVPAPEGTVLQSAELGLRGGIPWWVAVVALFVAGTWAIYLYFHEHAKLSIAVRVLLALLRTTVFALLLALLLRPVLLAEFAGERPRPVVLLLDSSQSMGQIDRRVTEADKQRVALVRGIESYNDIPDLKKVDLVRAALTNPQLGLLQRLRQRGPLQPFSFDRRLQSLIDSDDLAEQLQTEGPQTALADSLHELLMRSSSLLPAAVVLVTDGRDNASSRTLEEAAAACRERGVPLHIWGVGSTEAGILQLKEVKSPPAIFIDAKPDAVDDLVEIPLRYRARGFKGGTLAVTAKLGEQTVIQRIPLRDGENLSHTLRFRPNKGKEGERPLTVRLELDGNPDVADEVTRLVQVRSSRVKVLYVENVPRREYRFIQPVLDRDRRVLSRIWLVESDPSLAESPPDPESGARFLDRFPENFPDPDRRDPDRRPYDLLILGDVPYKALGADAARAIRQFVKEGGGLVMLAGPAHAPAEFVSTPLADVLPVELTRQEFTPDDMARATPFRPRLTYEGEQNPMLALDDQQAANLKLWKEDLWTYNPGFWWHYPVVDLRPGAQALVVHPDKQIGSKPDLKPMPIVATHYYGKGEVLFLGSDETWRWRDGTGDRLTARLWGQIVARLGLPHLLGNARRSQLDLERGVAIYGQPGSVKARILDSKYEPVVRPTIQAKLVCLDARDDGPRVQDVVLRRVAGQPGEYRGSLPNDRPGRHELRLLAQDGLEAATLPFTVELPPRHELEETGLAEEALRALASGSGGAFYREEQLAQLPETITPRSLAFTQRQEVLLWNPLALVVLLTLLTAEWLLRKFSNLS